MGIARGRPLRRRHLCGLLFASLSRGVAGQSAPTGQPVQATMREVDFHVAADLALRIEYLRGRLVPTRPGRPPFFDDPDSFSFAMDSARVSITAGVMAELLNRFVFAYRGAPLSKLRISVEGKQLRQRGRMNGMPFSLLSDVSVTPAGELRLHPVSIKAFGIPVKGVMSFLGMRLEKMMDLRKANGIRAERNDLLILPTALVPPPAIQGHLVAIELHDSVLVQVFRVPTGPVPPPLRPDTSATHYMYYRGGVLRFGHLTMEPADLLILDADPRDPFDFYLARYKEQLVAGFSRNTATDGLITVMPDYGKMKRPGTLAPRP